MLAVIVQVVLFDYERSLATDEKSQKNGVEVRRGLEAPRDYKIYGKSFTAMAAGASERLRLFNG